MRVNAKQAGGVIDESELRAIYSELEMRPHETRCEMRQTCCQFHLTGRVPVLTKGEALYAVKGVKAWGKKELPKTKEGGCPLLKENGRCGIYEHRPFGCRTHFCAAAGGVMPRKIIQDLIQRLEVLDEKLGGDGSKTIEQALREVW
jgi:Fe-S-cluster containining protein